MICGKKLIMVIVNLCLCENKWFKFERKYKHSFLSVPTVAKGGVLVLVPLEEYIWGHKSKKKVDYKKKSGI